MIVFLYNKNTIGGHGTHVTGIIAGVDTDKVK